MHEPLSRIAFFGTPQFAVPTFEALCDACRRPAVVVTQPGRPAGRGRRHTEPPVAVAARRRSIPVLQPERVRDEGFLAQLSGFAPELAIVVAYGQLFPPQLLELPPRGCINLHASLLPRHRGAAPVQAAILAGDSVSGVTTMRMEAGLDTGPILQQAEVPMRPDDNAGELGAVLAVLGAQLALSTIEAIEAGALVETPQDDSLATYAPLIRRADGRIKWQDSAATLVRRLQAFSPWPGLSCELNGVPLKVRAARVLSGAGGSDAPGTILGLREDCIAVVCGEETILGLERVQRPGRRPSSGAELWNGEHLHAGVRLS